MPNYPDPYELFDRNIYSIEDHVKRRVWNESLLDCVVATLLEDGVDRVVIRRRVTEAINRYVPRARPKGAPAEQPLQGV